MIFYVIQHPTRGTLIEFDHWDKRPKFQWSRPVYEGWSFHSVKAVNRMLNMLAPALRNKCTVVGYRSRPGRSPERIGALKAGDVVL